MDVHKELPPFDGEIRLDKLDEVEPEQESLMLLTAMTKGEVFGLILRRCTTSGAVPVYERTGFVNGTGTLKDLHHCGYGGPPSTTPTGLPEWPGDGYEGQSISSLLGGIGKSMIKIC